jgi:hypothetical protein
MMEVYQARHTRETLVARLGRWYNELNGGRIAGTQCQPGVTHGDVYIPRML